MYQIIQIDILSTFLTESAIRDIMILSFIFFGFEIVDISMTDDNITNGTFG